MTLRKIHKWLGLIAGLQLLAWTASGLYFSLLPIEEIRGEHLLQEAAVLKISHVSVLSPNALVQAHEVLADTQIGDIQLRQRGTGAVYEVRTEDGRAFFDATSGQPVVPLDETAARAVAASRTRVTIRDATLVEEVEAGDEYRGGELPAWRFLLEDGSHLYIGAASGRVRAVRTDAWRLYDFLWGLHIMDWDDREDFNHLILQFAAVLGLVTVVSGLALFGTTEWRNRRRHRRPA